MKTFINVKLVLPDGLIQQGFLQVEGDKITELGDMTQYQSGESELIDCGGCYLSPGFIDLHVHGGGGYDYMDGTVEDMIGASRAHLRYGTTALLPTTLTSSDEELFAVVDAFHQAKTITEGMPELLGLHLEGPYFCEEQKGAQDTKYICHPTPEHYESIVEYADGAIKRWSVAPELPGAIQMMDHLSGQGILFSAGHTSATHEEMKLAFHHGVKLLTHFYSAMSSIKRENGMRILGVVESGYLLKGLSVELIADGMHLPPDLLRLILRCKNHDEICLCTDSMRGACMPDGPSILGSIRDGQAVLVEQGIALMPDRSCFAGSVATTDRLVRVMVYQAGLAVWEAVRMMTLNPARFIGCDDHKGSLEIGKDADLVLFDENISVQAVYVRGQCAYQK
jgi:N-acetylglucosamine-6-phosphate deacetylase